MKSLILTSLYLLKDTVYRWKERPSSILSRMLVVFFLSLCAFSFLANYVLSVRMVQSQIRKNGGDLIILIEREMEGVFHKDRLLKASLPSLCDTELIILGELGAYGEIGEMRFPIVEYGVESLSGLSDLPLDQFPYLVLFTSKTPLQESPCNMKVSGYTLEMVARKMPENYVLEKKYYRGVILVPEGAAASLQGKVYSRSYLIKVNEMTYENIKKVDQTLRNINQLSGSYCDIISHLPLLEKLQLVESNQNECRAGFSIGIAVIVGILLTALASMEFRENEYIYTLMKSFGIRPVYLVLTYVCENIFIVGLSFIASLIFFLKVQKIIMVEFFKLGEVLTLNDLKEDVVLLAGALLLCVLVSSIPIVVSAYREIGRVLK